MFISHLNLESIIPRVQSRQAQTNHSVITLDFAGSEKGQPKRSSFLPASWDEDFNNSKYSSLGTSIYQVVDKPERTIREFCTGSKYTGEYCKLGMVGKGIYKFPHGVIYDGYFNKKGEFHGTGTLVYPAGQKIEGMWRNGKLMKGANYVTAGDVPYNNQYCTKPDRRFQIEVERELNPAGQEFLTNAPNPPREIHKSGYDTGEGYYVPDQKVIYDYKDPTKSKPLSEFEGIRDLNKQEIYDSILHKTQSQEFTFQKFLQHKIPGKHDVVSIPLEVSEKWIKENCRKAWDEPTGFRPDLYEFWTAGKRADKLTKVADDFKTEEAKIIEELAKMDVCNSHTASTLISFIITTGDQKPKTPSSLFALSKMLLPTVGKKTGVDDKLVKKARIHHVRRKVRKLRGKNGKNEKYGKSHKQDIKHFAVSFPTKLNFKIRKEQHKIN